MYNPSQNKKYIIDVVKYRGIWMTLSLLMLIPGIIAMIYASVTYKSHVPFKVGIDFVGGTIYQYSLDRDVTDADMSTIRTGLEKAQIESPVIQVMSSASGISDKGKETKIKNIISIRRQFVENESSGEKNEIASIVKGVFPNSELVSVSSVGPTLGAELFKKSLVAMVLAFFGIVVYLSFRFQLDFAVIAVLALLHDVMILCGIFAILGLVYGVQIDALFITAILTVIGFSVHDTIVVYDRIRENTKYMVKKAGFGEIVNASVNQTLVRSINTTLTTLITLIALYFFGGVTTKDFVLAMILGISIGMYSSIFFASVAIAWYRERGKVPA